MVSHSQKVLSSALPYPRSRGRCVPRRTAHRQLHLSLASKGNHWLPETCSSEPTHPCIIVVSTLLSSPFFVAFPFLQMIQDIDTFMKGMEAGKRGHTFAKVDESLEKLLPAGARGVKQSK